MSARSILSAARTALFCAPLLLVLGGAKSTRSSSLCGCWEGTWASCTDQFKGIVNAKITRCGKNRYEAVFTGWAFKIMPYRYKSTLIAWSNPETGCVHFKCEQKLPFWGQYWMRGRVCGCNFKARYNTDDHVGYFKMTRVSCD